MAYVFMEGICRGKRKALEQQTQVLRLMDGSNVSAGVPYGSPMEGS